MFDRRGLSLSKISQVSHGDMTSVEKNRPDDGMFERHIHSTKPLLPWDNPEFPYHETKLPMMKSVFRSKR